MKIDIFVKDYCPFCQKVLRYLESNGFEYTKTELTDEPELYEQLKKKTGHQTVPQVFINDEFIGGSDDFFANKKRYGL